MATDNLQIWNMALGYLKGDNTVDDETENSYEAKKCRLYWDTCLSFVLRDHLWSFAKKRESLALTGTAPDGWAYQYKYPTDCIKADRIYNSSDPQDQQSDRLDFEVAANPTGLGKVIWTNEASAQLIYGINVTDPLLWTADFDNALSLYLGHKLALAIANSSKRSQDLLNLYYATKSTAETNNVREGTKNVDHDADWIDAR